MLIFRNKSVKIYTGQKNFTRVYPCLPWQIWGMQQYENIVVHGTNLDAQCHLIRSLMAKKRCQKNIFHFFLVFFSISNLNIHYHLLRVRWQRSNAEQTFSVFFRCVSISWFQAYLIFVIFFTLAKFWESKIYTEKRQFFALNL